jgi:hypothetical protein
MLRSDAWRGLAELSTLTACTHPRVTQIGGYIDSTGTLQHEFDR